MKTCNTCNKEKEETAFSWKNKARGLRQPKCASCHKEYTKQHYIKHADRYKANKKKHRPKVRENLKRHILDYLLSHPCVDCGEADVEVLEFDHVELVGNAAKRVTHSTSKTRFDREVKLCEVRCANCHVRRTRKQLGTLRTKT